MITKIILLVALIGNIVYAQNNENKTSKNATVPGSNTDVKAERKDAAQAVKVNDLQKAIGSYEKIISSGNATAMDYNTLGWNYLLTTQYAKAFNVLNIAATMDSKNLYIKGNLAHVHLLTGDPKKAKEIYTKYKGQAVDDTMSWKQMIEIDFQEFKARGITSEHFDKILAALR